MKTKTPRSEKAVDGEKEENTVALDTDRKANQLTVGNEDGGAANSLDRTFLQTLRDNCKPSPETENARKQQDVLKSQNGDDAFVVSAQHVDITCISEVKRSPSGDYQGEVYYAVTTEVQKHCADRCRPIRFHGCVSETGHNFLLIEKLSTGSSWNLSKHEAIEQGSKAPIILRSSQDLQIYRFELVDTEIEDTLDEAAFGTLCEQAFSGMVVDSRDHPLLMNQMTSHSIWETE